MGRGKEARGKGETGDDTEPREELLCHSRNEGEGDPLANEHGSVDLGPSWCITNHLADDAFQEGRAGGAKSTPEVEGEGGEEVGITGAESRVFVGFLLLFIREGLEDGVGVVIPRGGEGVDGAEVDEEGAPRVEVREGDVAGAFRARREGDFLLAGDTQGTEDIGECITNAMVAFSEVALCARHSPGLENDGKHT